MVGAPARRRQVVFAQRRGLSQRKACALFSVSRSTLGYPVRPHRDRQGQRLGALPLSAPPLRALAGGNHRRPAQGPPATAHRSQEPDHPCLIFCRFQLARTRCALLSAYGAAAFESRQNDAGGLCPDARQYLKPRGHPQELTGPKNAGRSARSWPSSEGRAVTGIGSTSRPPSTSSAAAWTSIPNRPEAGNPRKTRKDRQTESRSYWARTAFTKTRRLRLVGQFQLSETNQRSVSF